MKSSLMFGTAWFTAIKRMESMPIACHRCYHTRMGVKEMIEIPSLQKVAYVKSSYKSSTTSRICFSHTRVSAQVSRFQVQSRKERKSKILFKNQCDTHVHPRGSNFLREYYFFVVSVPSKTKFFLQRTTRPQLELATRVLVVLVLVVVLVVVLDCCTLLLVLYYIINAISKNSTLVLVVVTIW